MPKDNDEYYGADAGLGFEDVKASETLQPASYTRTAFDLEPDKIPEDISDLELPPWIKTKPYRHQLVNFHRFKDAEYFGLFFEQRCGKTKTILDIIAHKRLAGEIDAVVILAPNDVHRLWLEDEFPKHFSEAVPYQGMIWNSTKAATGKKYNIQLDALIKAPYKLPVLLVNIDALTTETFKKYMSRFLRVRKRVFAVIDESNDIASPGAKRTRTAMSLAQRASFRAILDGTPAAAGPFGLYAQTNFLRFGILGFKRYDDFKTRYAQFELKKTGAGQQYLTVKEYQRLGELRRNLKPFTARVRRCDVKDMPADVWTKRYFDMTPKQAKFYHDLRTQFMAEIGEGSYVSAPTVIARYLRLQQVASNLIGGVVSTCHVCAGHDDACPACMGSGFILKEEAEWIDPDKNPRLDLLFRTMETLDGQGIVWAKFRPEFPLLSEALTKRGISNGMYYGAVPKDERTEIRKKFQRGDIQVFIGNPHAAGRGLDLSNANWVIYYSHSFSTRMRLQSKDRALSLQKTEPTMFIDLIGADTVDQKIMKTLEENCELAEFIVSNDPTKLFE